jgi:hypothetical protein
VGFGVVGGFADGSAEDFLGVAVPVCAAAGRVVIVVVRVGTGAGVLDEPSASADRGASSSVAPTVAPLDGVALTDVECFATATGRSAVGATSGDDTAADVAPPPEGVDPNVVTRTNTTMIESTIAPPS